MTFKRAGHRREPYGVCPFCGKRGLYATGLEGYSIKVHQIVCKHCRESEPVPDFDVKPDLSIDQREEYAFQMLCLRAHHEGRHPGRRKGAG